MVQALIILLFLNVNKKNRSTNWLVESLHGSVLGRHGHALHVSFVAHGLEVPTAKQEVHFYPLLLFQAGNGLVDLVQLAMATAFNRNLHPERVKQKWEGNHSVWCLEPFFHILHRAIDGALPSRGVVVTAVGGCSCMGRLSLSLSVYFLLIYY